MAKIYLRVPELGKFRSLEREKKGKTKVKKKVKKNREKQKEESKQACKQASHRASEQAKKEKKIKRYKASLGQKCEVVLYFCADDAW